MKQIFYFLLFCMMILVSCSEEQLPEYVNQPGLYFYRERSYTVNAQRDSLSFTFYTKQKLTGEQYTQYIDIRTIGMPEAHDRKFKLVQDNAGDDNAAIPGVHYIGFDDPSIESDLVIPANAISYKVPVTCINDPSLATKKVRLKIKIGENENFGVGIHAQSTFIINFSDVAERPDSWRDNDPIMNWWPWFGDWSAVKMKFISISLDIYDFDEAYINAPYKDYYARKMYRLLREYNEAHPNDPMLDENGNLIQFPEKYAN